MERPTLEHLARLRAALDSTSVPSDVLKEAGLDEARWAELEGNLLFELDDRLERGDAAGIEAYRAVYSAARAGRDGPVPQVGRETGAASAPAPVPPGGPVDLDPDETAMTNAREVLAGLRSLPFTGTAPAPAPEPLIADDHHGGTAEMDVSPFRAAYAASVASREKAPSSPVHTAPTPDADITDSTGMINVRAAMLGAGAPLPFTEGVAAPPPQAPIGEHEDTGTVMMAPSPLHKVLPFTDADLPMPLEEIARVEVGCRSLEERAAVLARFGLTEATWEPLRRRLTLTLITEMPFRERYDAMCKKVKQQV